ncbi:glycoside hydrolase family 53 protein [Niveomyces insectorum RCEF 264]|uniref:Arabinogalactan endo-beta-1,4-galactanase n=1 Tax=Niveomyces insectorum RCEF 264 TaxID=1081102 RepID=A0A167TU89_9HYPO|nr:glycoside hydrolase family 53 protein [Niveomyces insectorum RCEF 264]
MKLFTSAALTAHGTVAIAATTSLLPALAAASPSPSLAYRGVDWSSVAVEEAAGVVYKTTAGQPVQLETLLAASGVNMVRQRLWVHPTANSGAYNLSYNLALARRARAAGMAVYLDLHLSDTWADPGHQAIPAAWPHTREGLTARLFNYTRDVCDAFMDAYERDNDADHGSDTGGGGGSNNGRNNTTQPPPLSIISLGNEITAGLLWPVGTTKSYETISALLHAASAGVKASRLAPPPRIMIHLDNGWSWSTQQSFYSRVLQDGKNSGRNNNDAPSLTTADFDTMGVSYYPFYNAGATLASLRTSLENMASTWGKNLVVAETDWPTSCPSPRSAFPNDAKGIPFSAAGQAAWVQAVAAVVAAVPGGRGLFYWEPAWVHNANLGSSCADNLMVSSSGQALSSLSVFSQI